MPHHTVTITLIGGPTALIEVGGFRLLTDPTFSPPGDYPAGVTLTKTAGPAIAAEAIGPVDAVLLSHDEHADNLDPAGRAYLGAVAHTLTTPSGAGRLASALGERVTGLAPWATYDLSGGASQTLHITGTPARHGPAGFERITGDVVGFVLAQDDQPAIYVTGDTVWYEGVAEVAQRFPNVGLVVAFTGAAQTRGPISLTMTADDAVETARAFPNALIAPVHHDSWAHFTQTQADVIAAFAAAGLSARLRPLTLGAPMSIEI